MRLRRGRPDIATYHDRLTVAKATDDAPLSVTFLGVSSLLFRDASSALLTDGFFSRPSLRQVATGAIGPNPARIGDCLARAGVQHLDAVLPVHTHYDHALDSAAVAQRTGAILAGGTSAANIARGHGLPPEQIAVVTPGSTVRYGHFEVVALESTHCPPDRFPGEITAPVPRRAKARAYRCGEAWSLLIGHTPTGRTALVQGSAGYVDGALDGYSADVAYLGVGQLGIQPIEYLTTYWRETVGRTQPRRVVLIHWDDFFAPLDRPLRAVPYAFDDLDVTMRVFGELSQRDGVPLQLPTLWHREDPWLA
jgi:L-ascorbate metabolism protein UlaG (beta-lactamase superfamily)